MAPISIVSTNFLNVCVGGGGGGGFFFFFFFFYFFFVGGGGLGWSFNIFLFS